MRPRFLASRPLASARVALVPVVTLAGLTTLATATCKPATDQGTIEILTVDDPFEVDGGPPATEITAVAIAYDDGGLDGAVTTLAEGPISQAMIDLGTYDEGTIESIQVTATDRAGTTVAWGETLPIELAAVAGVSLGVFVQRTGALSRMPNPLPDARTAPIVSMVGGRYILVAGGTDTSLAAGTDLYDLVAWAPLASPPSFPFAPESVVVAAPGGDIQALAISSTGAEWYDLTHSDTSDASAPAGTGAWADVAGGITITRPDQSFSYVVGGTRTGASGPPTTAVLVVSATGSLSWAGIGGTNPRLGATAAWVEGFGLVIEGGNAATPEGDASTPPPGAEFLENDMSWSPINCASDTTTGAAMVVLGPGASSGTAADVLVVGGATSAGGGASARVLTMSVNAMCTEETWQSTLPTPLTFTQAFGIDSSTAFVVGEDVTGFMHAYRLSENAVAEVPFRVPRSHARAIQLPLGAPGAGPIAIVGGDVNIESFIP